MINIFFIFSSISKSFRLTFFLLKFPGVFAFSTNAINFEIFGLQNSVLTFEAVKAVNILFYTMISEPMGVGSIPTQGN